MARSFYFNNIDREIANLVAEGEIVFALSRPISFQGMMIAGALGESMFRLLFFTVPICATLLLIYPVQPPASVGAGAAFALSCVMALLILVQINFLVGLTALYLKSIQGVLRAKHYLLELLSGLLLPVTLFPDWLEKASSWLPFQSLTFVPSSIYLGRISGSGLGRALGVQVFWAVLLAAAGALWWRRISRRLTVHGG
jgi:ABC-2 type transport system permease protein